MIVKADRQVADARDEKRYYKRRQNTIGKNLMKIQDEVDKMKKKNQPKNKKKKNQPKIKLNVDWPDSQEVQWTAQFIADGPESTDVNSFQVTP